MFPIIASAVFAALSIASACVATSITIREKKARLRELAELKAELTQLRAELEELAEAIHPTRAITPHSPRRDRGQKKGPMTGPILIAVPDLAPPCRGDQPIPPEFAERFGGIWDLADSGASASTIARATGQPVGRIELILALRRDGSRD